MSLLAIIPGLPGGPEVLVILLIGLLLFGGRLPEVGKSIGKSIVEFRKGLRGLKDEVGLDKEMRSIQRDFEDASRATAMGTWPEGEAKNPWAELDANAPSAEAARSADTPSPEPVVDVEASPAADEASGPVARGEVTDAPATDAPSPDAPDAPDATATPEAQDSKGA